jgi:hypothetical protein
VVHDPDEVFQFMKEKLSYTSQPQSTFVPSSTSSTAYVPSYVQKQPTFSEWEEYPSDGLQMQLQISLAGKQAEKVILIVQ